MLAFTSIALALVTTAAAQGTSTITTLGSTVTVSIITYRSFNIDPYKTTTYVSLIGSNANTTTFAIDRECFTGIEAFPTFPICGHHVESPKFLTVGPTHLAMTTIAPVTSANDYSSSDNPTWQLTQNCRISRSDEMTCTVEQTGPSWVLSNMYASGAERSVITDTASSQEWPPPDTTEGIIPGPTGTGISSQTSTFTYTIAMKCMVAQITKKNPQDAEMVAQPLKDKIHPFSRDRSATVLAQNMLHLPALKKFRYLPYAPCGLKDWQNGLLYLLHGIGISRSGNPSLPWHFHGTSMVKLILDLRAPRYLLVQ
ncbi:MAG: hypothetical protein M1820_002495 [Bogoriella megaspora]|nr:MAG: hypothetical protein M1820_002495 [Bogoriella megaspora]